MSGHKPDFAFLSEKRGQEIAEKAFCMMIRFLRGDVFVNILSTNNKFQSQMVLIKPQLEILLSFVTTSLISIPCFVNRRNQVIFE